MDIKKYIKNYCIYIYIYIYNIQTLYIKYLLYNIVGLYKAPNK